MLAVTNSCASPLVDLNTSSLTLSVADLNIETAVMENGPGSVSSDTTMTSEVGLAYNTCSLSAYHDSSRGMSGKVEWRKGS